MTINGYDQMLQDILLEQDPTGWRMLVGCILLNQTSRAQVDGVREELFRRFPDPRSVRECIADHDSLVKVLKPLGLYNRRASTLIAFAEWWREARKHPRSLDERIVALEPPGVGEYARDSWMIFKMRVVPTWPIADHVLAEYLTAACEP